MEFEGRSEETDAKVDEVLRSLVSKVKPEYKNLVEDVIVKQIEEFLYF